MQKRPVPLNQSPLDSYNDFQNVAQYCLRFATFYSSIIRRLKLMACPIIGAHSWGFQFALIGC